MSLPTGTEVGFCFQCMAADGETRIVVNVCGNSAVGRPLTKNSEEAPESYLDDYGIDNLVVPISVGSLRSIKGKKNTFTVDVVVHPFLTQRCVQAHRLFEHYIARLTSLAVDWVLQECGVRLLVHTCRIISDRKYFENRHENMEQILSDLAKAIEKGIQENVLEKSRPESVPLPPELQLGSHPVKEDKRASLIKEMPKGSGIRKGFLDNVRLYGDKGSRECQLPPMDPLHHIPEGLRNRCQVVDMRDAGSGATNHSSNRNSHPIEQNITTGVSRNVSSGKWRIEYVRCIEDKVLVLLHPPDNFVSMQDVSLTALPSLIEIDETAVELPKPIDVDRVSAKFRKTSRTLLVSCPLA